MRELGTVSTVRRYPVKSMLGEDLTEAAVTVTGVDNDRAFALIDSQTGRVASAKQPRLWRELLQCRATCSDGSLLVTLPDGRTLGPDNGHPDDGHLDDALSGLLGRPVRLSHTRADGASVARPAPEAVIEHGVSADVPYEVIEIGRGSSGRTFVDYAPISLITTATLAHLGTEWVRYRPNIVIASSPHAGPFAENAWAGREIRLGTVRVRGLIPTPRCAIPTLAHGSLPRRVDAVRRLLTDNRIDVPGIGAAPCAGVYAEVVEGGTIHAGDTAVLA
jgi:uncharacterized protein YcbX